MARLCHNATFAAFARADVPLLATGRCGRAIATSVVMKFIGYLVYVAAAVSALSGGQVMYEQNLGANLLAVDANGNAYAASPGKVTKLAPDGTVLYSASVNLNGTWFAIAVDPAGEVVIVGATNADDLPTSPGVLQPKRNASGACVTLDKNSTPYPCGDAFVAKLDANGHLAWATYFGGRGPEQANAVAMDAAGNVYLAGLTQSIDLPVTSAFQNTFGGYADAFVSKVSADGTKLLYSSYLGGEGYEIAHGIAVDAAGTRMW
jgi:hypothetical protein